MDYMHVYMYMYDVIDDWNKTVLSLCKYIA